MRTIFLVLMLCILALSCQDKQNAISSITSEQHKTKEVVLTGSIDNADLAAFGKEVGIAYPDATTSEYIEKKVPIDSSTGAFRLAFDMAMPAEVYFFYYRGTELLLHPGDSLHITVDGSSKTRDAFYNTLSLSGAAAALNKEFIAYSQAFPFDYQKNQGAIENEDPEAYREFLDVYQAERNAQIERYISEKQISTTFQRWLSLERAFEKKTLLLKYPPTYNMLTRKWLDVDNSYFDEAMTVPEITEADLVNANVSSDYPRYYYYQLRTEVQQQLSDAQKKDPAVRDSALVAAMMEFSKQHRLMGQLVVLQDFRARLNNNRIESFEKYQPALEQLFDDSPFWTPLSEKYATVKKRLENPEMPEGTEILSFDGIPSEAYLKEIIANANGKVIYIDNWATWCAPCKAEFIESTPRLKATFEKEVEFVYLCHQSEERLWKPSIAEFKVTGKHYFLEKEESQPIFKQINLQGFPTYTIINKKGEIVHSGFEYRPSLPETTKILHQLIAE